MLGLMFGLLLVGCERRHGRMEQAEDPQGRYREQIAVARRLLAQEEDWSDRAEWEVEPVSGGWRVTAWRVERPRAKGAERYVPWGYSVIDLDRNLEAVRYRRKG